MKSEPWNPEKLAGLDDWSEVAVFILANGLLAELVPPKEEEKLKEEEELPPPPEPKANGVPPFWLGAELAPGKLWF